MGGIVVSGVPGVREITDHGLWPSTDLAHLSEAVARVPPPEDQVAVCIAWLRARAKPQRGVSDRRSSYSYKHDVEDWTRTNASHPVFDQIDPQRRPQPISYFYVSNGAFIEAARREGYRIVPTDRGSLNAFFNLDARTDDRRRYDEMRAYQRSDAASWRHRTESPRPRGLGPSCEFYGHSESLVRHGRRIHRVAWVALETDRHSVTARLLRCPNCGGEHTFDAGPVGGDIADHLGAPPLPCWTEDDEDNRCDASDYHWLLAIPDPPAPRATTLGFNAWLLEQYRRDDPVGDLACEEIEGACFTPKDALPPLSTRAELAAHVERNTYRDEVVDALFQAWWEWQRCRAITVPPGSRVYFIRRGDDGPIKIGVSGDVARRLASLQTATPERLRLLATLPGDRALERDLHRRFAALAIGGEWFRAGDELLEFVRTIGAAAATEVAA